VWVRACKEGGGGYVCREHSFSLSPVLLLHTMPRVVKPCLPCRAVLLLCACCVFACVCICACACCVFACMIVCDCVCVRVRVRACARIAFVGRCPPLLQLCEGQVRESVAWLAPGGAGAEHANPNHPIDRPDEDCEAPVV
jgi:hypothetical protein